VEQLLAHIELMVPIPLEFPEELHTPSPGAELRQGVGLRGPVQGRRECGTLSDIPCIILAVESKKKIVYEVNVDDCNGKASLEEDCRRRH
jgi:hypothetical protein